MYKSLRRFLAGKIEVYYDDDWNVIETIGCKDDLRYIKEFCQKIMQNEDLFEEIMQELNQNNIFISCDCQYLTNQEGDFIVTESGQLPFNPN